VGLAVNGGGSWEPKLLGPVEAEAERLAAEKWSGLRLEVIAHRGNNVPRSPPRDV
jgi:hypothetical protein